MLRISSYIRKFFPSRLGEKDLYRVCVSHDLLTITSKIIASFGPVSEPHEGIAYWAGVPLSESKLVITTVLAPEAVTTPGSFKTSALANARVISEVNSFKLQILAQVHGHPSSWVGHSLGDDMGAFMPYEGFLSIVVPNYGYQGMTPLSKCGIHRYSSGGFSRLSNEDVDAQFIEIPAEIDLRKLNVP